MLTKNLWKIQVTGWLIYFVLMFLTFLSRNTDESIEYILLVKSFRTLLGFSLSYLLWLVYRTMINKQTISKIILVAILACTLFGVIWTLCETLLFWFTLPHYDILNSLQFKPRVVLSYSVTLLAWSAIFFGIEYWKQVQAEQKRTLEARMLAKTAKLEMLRYQLNPHFLFNALNSIRASIDNSNIVSKQMITHLSEFLRHSLLSSETRDNTLSEELAAVESYLAIEKIRFEESLHFSFDIEEKAKGHMVPCFILNPLVENAIKHGFKNSSNSLTIIVKAVLESERKLIIDVINSGTLNQKLGVEPTKIGVNNVKERLEKRLGDKSSFRLYEEQGFVIARIEINTK